MSKLPGQLHEKLKHHARKAYHGARDHFVPHQGNNYHPHVLKHRVLFAYSIIIVLIKVLTIVLPIALPSSSLYSSAITPKNIIDLTNQTRKNLGLAVLTTSSTLNKSAQAKAEDMIEHQYFAHTSPQGISPWEWFKKVGYDYIYAGENLAIHFKEAEDVNAGWLASPTHRANIVNPNYTEIGVGVVLGEFQGVTSTVVVQEFAQPASVAGASAKTSAITTTPVVPVTVPKTAPLARVAVKSAEDIKSPLPTPIAIKSEPVSTASAVAPVLDEATLVLKQSTGNYLINIRITGASSVAAGLASQWVPLNKSSDTDIWSGSISYNETELSKHGEQLWLAAYGAGGAVTNKVLAWVAPQVATQQLYTFNEGTDKYTKLFSWLTIHNLDDSVRRFYFYFLVGLGAALLLNVLIKIRIQRLSVINHTMIVMALTLLMYII